MKIRVRRLHIQFYLAILATLAVFLLVSSLFWSLTRSWRSESWGLETAAQLAGSLLPPATATPAEQQRVIGELRERLRMELALYGPEGQLLAQAGRIPRISSRQLAEQGWTFSRGGPVWILPLSDGRQLVVRPQHAANAPRIGVIIAPLSIVIAFALGAYPIARRLTRRVARLQAGVDQLGAGDLTTRVAVEGEDEVAALARSFNRSAGRIEELVKSHKLLLANCSHELRTPLARIRLALERMAPDAQPALRDEIKHSIAELDALIGEMLLASRLDALRTLERSEEVDLLALTAEEAAHFDQPVEGRAAVVQGDPTLLRRLVRNLLDNARRHGGGATRVQVDRNEAGDIELIIEDHGCGIPEEERERIFEPFYRTTRTSSSIKGFGLGLAIIRQIAQAHGGDVRYTTLEESGSRFTVILPRSGSGAR